MFIYLFSLIWKVVQKNERHRNLPPIGSLSNYLQQPGWARLEARNQELHPGLWYGWHAPKYLRHHCCVPGCKLARRWNQEHSWNFSPSILTQDVGIPSAVLSLPQLPTLILLIFKYPSHNYFWYCHHNLVVSYFSVPSKRIAHSKK